MAIRTDLSYCETIHAVSPRWHLRPLARGEERKPGGGVNKPTLCGLVAAWDISSKVDDKTVSELGCSSCVANMPPAPAPEESAP
jgi:hypothetical protein